VSERGQVVVEKRGGIVLLENEIERGCLDSARAQALELKISAL
jgi:hypothetical protein